MFKRAEFFRAFLFRTRRITPEDIEAEVFGHGFDTLSDISYAHDADSAAIDLDSLSCRDAVQCRKDVLHHSAGIASFSVCDLDTTGCAIIKVYMVHADRRRRDHTD